MNGADQQTSAVNGANRWTVATYLYAGMVVTGVGYFLFEVPIQVTDSFGNIVAAGHGTLWSLVYGELHQRAYLRPFLWAALRIVLDLSHGHYYEWFRGLHVVLVALLVILFLRVVRPRTWADAAAVSLGLAALIGIHTFAGTVLEAFPINTFLVIVLCCLAAADLSLGPTRWWRSAAAAALFVFAALSVESGLLVAVVFAAAYIMGARGISRTGVLAIVLLTAGYFVLRFAILHVGSPGLDERSSGFGLSRYDPAALIRMFGGHPLAFYAYNVTSSVLSVLFAEPRAGTFALAAAFVAHRLRVYMIVNVLASTLGTCLIGAYGWRHREAVRRWEFDRGAQIVGIFIAVMLANAFISYGYTKDVILSPAGTFFALALTVATADFLWRISHATMMYVAAGSVLLLTLSGAWAFRAVGIHIALRDSGRTMRNEWAYVDEWLAREHQTSNDARFNALKEQLQRDAVLRHPSQARLRATWVDWFED